MRSRSGSHSCPETRTLYMLSGGRDRSDWVKNLRHNPEVEVRIAGEHLSGRSREASDAEEDELARRLLVEKYESSPGSLANWRRTALPIAVDLSIMHSRAACPKDAETIARIYNEGIEERIATFETRPRTAAEIQDWFDDGYPIVVVEEVGTVLSFANMSAYSSRECYSGVAEFSVYTASEARGNGAGTLAVKALMEAAENAGFWKLVSRVFVENEPSRKLLFSLGFREVGVHEKHARLDGLWRDVVVVERLIPANL